MKLIEITKENLFDDKKEYTDYMKVLGVELSNFKSRLNFFSGNKKENMFINILIEFERNITINKDTTLAELKNISNKMQSIQRLLKEYLKLSNSNNKDLQRLRKLHLDLLVKTKDYVTNEAGK